MRRVFADANVFLRLFTNDDRAQQAKAARLLEDAEKGRVLLVCGPPVLFDLAWKLRLLHKLSRDQVLDVIARVLATPGLELSDRALVEEALWRARTAQQEFADRKSVV
jgi:predicted nucleic-acid-binding protein